MQKVTPFIWLEKDALGAARYYQSIFGDENVVIQGEEGLDNTPSGSVQILTLTIFGTIFRLMSAGPLSNYTEMISFEVSCQDQDEVDRYWNGLTADGGSEGACGWCKDKFGISWQIVPVQLGQLMSDPDPKKAQNTMQAMLTMKKLIVADLQKAHDQN